MNTQLNRCSYLSVLNWQYIRRATQLRKLQCPCPEGWQISSPYYILFISVNNAKTFTQATAMFTFREACQDLPEKHTCTNTLSLSGKRKGHNISRRKETNNFGVNRAQWNASDAHAISMHHCGRHIAANCKSKGGVHVSVSVLECESERAQSQPLPMQPTFLPPPPAHPWLICASLGVVR